MLEFNGEADHVHLLLALTPKVLPSAFVNNLKTVSSRLLRKEFADHLKRYYWSKPVFWSRSYCIGHGMSPKTLLALRRLS